MDMSLKNVWESWFAFRKRKHCTAELHAFQFFLEKNLFELHRDLCDGTYKHGRYRKFIVSDNKRREISVAGIRDRVVHRLLYDYLNKIYDKTFIYDAWSCRTGKGLLGAIERTQTFLRCYPDTFIWKADIRKFFDHIDHARLKEILSFRVKDPSACDLLNEIIGSYSTVEGESIGIPIGNLTSQIFANIYLNELDRFVQYELKPAGYVRYGDDFIIIEKNREKLLKFRGTTGMFLQNYLKLHINPKSDRIIFPREGLKLLGVVIWPSGRTLNKRNLLRVRYKLNPTNVSSYHGLIMKHCSQKQRNMFDLFSAR